MPDSDILRVCDRRGQGHSQIAYPLLTSQTPNLLGFELAGYRIQSGEKGNQVTIDCRHQPGTERQFISLSMCEQSVLFGSLRKTLLEPTFRTSDWRN